MRKSELELMMIRAKELAENATPEVELLAMAAVLCGEQILQMGEVKRVMAEFSPKIDATARAVAELEEKIDGKLALTRYDFGEQK